MHWNPVHPPRPPTLRVRWNPAHPEEEAVLRFQRQSRKQVRTFTLWTYLLANLGAVVVKELEIDKWSEAVLSPFWRSHRLRHSEAKVQGKVVLVKLRPKEKRNFRPRQGLLLWQQGAANRRGVTVGSVRPSQEVSVVCPH